MNVAASTIALWGYGLSAIGYLFYAIVHQGTQREVPGPGYRRLIWLALLATTTWAALAATFLTTLTSLALQLHWLMDSLRYLAWHACLLVLLLPANPPASPDTQNSLLQLLRQLTRETRLKKLWWAAVAICSIGLACHLLLLTTPASWHASIKRIHQFNGLTTVIFAISLLEQLLRNTPQESRWSLKPLTLGLGAVFAFDLYLYSSLLLFGSMDEDIFIARGYVQVMALPLLALASKRMNQPRARLQLSQTLVFHTTTLIAAGLYLLAASAVGYYVRYFGGDWGSALQLMLLFAAVLVLAVLMSSGAMRARIRVLVGKHFFRYRYDYREEWLKFTRTLSAPGAAQEVGQRLIKGLADLVESPGGVLWLDDGSGQRHVPSARWNSPEISATEPADSPLCRFVDASGWVLNLEEYRRSPGRYENLELPEWLTLMSQAWLLVPLSVGEHMVGFVVLTTARTPIDVDWEVNDLLKTAARQAASFITQVQATEALLEARKFEAFNRMSAFVVHDLKNIITQLSLMTKNAQRHMDNPEFRQDMLLTLENSVERMRQLMLQLREGATPPGVACGVDLAAILQRIAQTRTHQPPGLSLHIEAQPSARGHEERIERVIGHMVQNALDATPAAGRVEAHLSLKDNMACIDVIDTGHGMSQEFIRERLFKPFQTTKQAGMGIGAYESYQYIQELGGRIIVDSTLNVGTRMRILLPLFNITSGSDLPRLEAVA